MIIYFADQCTLLAIHQWFMICLHMASWVWVFSRESKEKKSFPVSLLDFVAFVCIFVGFWFSLWFYGFFSRPWYWVVTCLEFWKMRGLAIMLQEVWWPKYKPLSLAVLLCFNMVSYPCRRWTTCTRSLWYSSSRRTWHGLWSSGQGLWWPWTPWWLERCGWFGGRWRPCESTTLINSTLPVWIRLFC